MERKKIEREKKTYIDSIWIEMKEENFLLRVIAFASIAIQIGITKWKRVK